VTKEEDVCDLVRPGLVDQVPAHQSALLRPLCAFGIKANKAILSIGAGNCFETHAVSNRFVNA
jgi:hypothetical protein